MKQRPWLWVLIGIASAFVLLVAIFFFVGLMALKSAGTSLGEGNVALVHVEGLITSGKGAPSPWGGGTGSESLLNILDRVSKNDRFKAIVLRVNSPGGTAAGSQEIYEKLLEIRKQGKKIVISMGDVAASGAYYISSASDKIFAEPSTLTGSIGVLAQLMDLHGLFEKLGVREETLKAGRLKDLGNENRPLTPEERKLFQKILNETHEEFISDVAKGRKLKESYVRNLADGRVYTGRQALKLHLVDQLGNLEDAEREAASLAGIAGPMKVVNVDRKSFLEELLGESMSTRSLLVTEWLQRGMFGSAHQGIFFLPRKLPSLY